MKLTPGQVAELKSTKNVRGFLADGDRQVPVYLVAISFHTFERVQMLTSENALPGGILWYVVFSTPTRVELFTTQPEWFVELEDQIDATRRPHPQR